MESSRIPNTEKPGNPLSELYLFISIPSALYNIIPSS